MIGVVANQTDLQTAEEFFELFKTQWEPAVPSRKYSVVLSTDDCAGNFEAEVLLIYGSESRAVDRAAEFALEALSGPVDVEWGESAFPIYGPVAVFDADVCESTLRAGGKSLEYQHHSGAQRVRRIGYDLFREVHYLLTAGQPASQALTPTLELHIALLRSVLLDSGVPFVEIPPRPEGLDFICCLTHDVDFFGIRRHRCDRTLAGFVARASVGTLIDLLKGVRPVAEAVRNWGALLSLPLVYLGLARDFWQPFADYAQVEEGPQSTFFLVPFRGRVGIAPDGTVRPKRAVPYQISDVGAEVNAALTDGSELGVHGIDAWRDAEAGRTELTQLTSVTGRSTAGIRMHWLYFADDSPIQLEAAGYEYDSTWGYNEAVGYRAGTSQVFRLPGTRNLMELPMSIMDSALFYASRMNLTQDEALEVCRRIVATARQCGGTLVLNWHCRSLAPERLWGRFYQELLAEVRENHKAWFATAAQAVAWFRWRRSIRFVNDADSNEIVVAAPVACPGPAAMIRVHRPALQNASLEELRFDGHQAVRLSL